MGLDNVQLGMEDRIHNDYLKRKKTMRQHSPRRFLFFRRNRTLEGRQRNGIPLLVLLLIVNSLHCPGNEDRIREMEKRCTQNEEKVCTELKEILRRGCEESNNHRHCHSLAGLFETEAESAKETEKKRQLLEEALKWSRLACYLAGGWESSQPGKRANNPISADSLKRAASTERIVACTRRQAIEMKLLKTPQVMKIPSPKL